MMREFRCTLLGDGSSDRVLNEVLRWLLPQHGVEDPDLQFYSFTDLKLRLQRGQELFPAELAWVDPTARCVPVRMTESWLLIDQPALREASGKRNGRQPLEWPELSRLEDLPDAKAVALKLLKDASEFHGRRLKNFDERAALTRLAQLIADYAPLRELNSFLKFEEDLVQALKAWKQ